MKLDKAIEIQPDATHISRNIQQQKDQAKFKAIESLSGYKFIMFGYYAALWVSLNRLDSNHEHNPFSSLVNQARLMLNGGKLCK